MNTIPLQINTVDTLGNSTNSAWLLNKKFCYDTPIFNRAIYYKNFFHCDSFQSQVLHDDEKNPVRNSDILDGLSTETNLQYIINYRTSQHTAAAAVTNPIGAANIGAGTALTVLNVAVFVKHLLITKDGVQFV